MEFKGYLLKINDMIVPNKFINITTYKATPNRKRKLDEFLDGDGVRREAFYPHQYTSIEFETNGMLMDGKTEFIAYFQTPQLTVEYWNDKKAIYETGLFSYDDLDFQMYKVRGNNIIYKPLFIMLTEY